MTTGNVSHLYTEHSPGEHVCHALVSCSTMTVCLGDSAHSHLRVELELSQPAALLKSYPANL